LNSHPALILSIPAPKDRQDAILRETIAPLLREFASSSQLDAAYFERFNKPDWGIRFLLLGAPAWVEKEARPLLLRRVVDAVEGSAFVAEDPEDKWVGGVRERQHLKRIHHLDSLACLERIEIEVRGSRAGTRAQFSLLLVERLLDLFGLTGATRLAFYRRGFQWEQDLGRWDGEVFAALEKKYESQKEVLRSTLECQADEAHAEAWGGADSSGIALRFLDAAREPVTSILAAHAASSLERSLLDLAVFAAHAHSNRLGIHATQEATLRYLAWRARAGRWGGGS
jgi:thiopeptide-type bacteriocin biosynthesis protein